MYLSFVKYSLFNARHSIGLCAILQQPLRLLLHACSGLAPYSTYTCLTHIKRAGE